MKRIEVIVLLESKTYTVTDITDLYGVQRATLYYRFKNQYKDYVVIGEDGVQTLSQEGLDKMIEDYDLKLIDESAPVEPEEVEEKVVKNIEAEPKPIETIQQTDSNTHVDRLIEALEKQLEEKEEEIKRLHTRMDSLDTNLQSALELNRNNQVLLLRSEDKVKELEISIKEENKESDEETEVKETEFISEAVKETNVEPPEQTEEKKGFFARLFNK